jgi:hypothetical protein
MFNVTFGAISCIIVDVQNFQKSKAKGPITVTVPFSIDGSPLGVTLGLSVWDSASIVVEDVKCGSIVDR